MGAFNVAEVEMVPITPTPSLPDKLREDINVKSSFAKFEEPNMLKFQSRISTGISHTIGNADKQQT